MMEDNSSRLIPYICTLLSRYPQGQADSSAQLLLRVIQENPLFLTDGFYTIEARYSGPALTMDLFLKATSWNVSLLVGDLVLELKTIEVIGHEKMQAGGLPQVKQHPEVLRLLTPALRAQVKGRLDPKSREEVQVLLKLFEDHMAYS